MVVCTRHPTAAADPNIINIYGNTALILAARTGNLKAVKALLPLTTKWNIQTVDSRTALRKVAENDRQAIVVALLVSGAEVEPQEPGPHCSFLDLSERLSDFGRYALTSALFSKSEAPFRAILSLLAQREPLSQYTKVLRSLEVDGRDSFSIEGCI